MMKRMILVVLMLILAVPAAGKGEEAGNKLIYAEEGQFPFVYRRGEFYIAVNPSAEMTAVTLPVHAYEIIFRIGEGSLKENEISLSAQSFLLLKQYNT